MAKTQAEQVLDALLDTREDAFLTVTPGGRIHDWSRGAERLYGYCEGEIVGRPLTLLLPIYEVPALEKLLNEAACGEIPKSETSERLRKDGSRLVVNLKRSVVRASNGEVVLIVEAGREFYAHSGVNNGDGHLKELVDQLPLVLWTTDQRLRITSNWGCGSEITKIHPGEFAGKTVFDLLKCHDPKGLPIEQHQNALRGAHSRFEYWRGDRALDIQLGPLRSVEGEIVGCTGVALDVTDRKKVEDEARFQAAHDALTGLANYREFLNTLEREIRRSDRTHRPFAVLLLDLDDLKAINDRFGHLTGNRALKRLAAVMKENSRATDLAARYGGDEFALLLIDANPGMAEQAATRIQALLKKESELPSLSVSIGMAISPDDGRTVQELLEIADRRLYHRKREARARAV